MFWVSGFGSRVFAHCLAEERHNVDRMRVKEFDLPPREDLRVRAEVPFGPRVPPIGSGSGRTVSG